MLKIFLPTILKVIAKKSRLFEELLHKSRNGLSSADIGFQAFKACKINMCL